MWIDKKVKQQLKLSALEQQAKQREERKLRRNMSTSSSEQPDY